MPDASTCADALAILARYGIAIPSAARAGLESGAFETPKPGDPLFALDTRRQMLVDAVAHVPGARVELYYGLAVDAVILEFA